MDVAAPPIGLDPRVAWTGISARALVLFWLDGRRRRRAEAAERLEAQATSIATLALVHGVDKERSEHVRQEIRRLTRAAAALRRPEVSTVAAAAQPEEWREPWKFHPEAADAPADGGEGETDGG